MTYDEAIAALRAYNSAFDGEAADAVEAEIKRLRDRSDMWAKDAEKAYGQRNAERREVERLRFYLTEIRDEAGKGDSVASGWLLIACLAALSGESQAR